MVSIILKKKEIWFYFFEKNKTGLHLASYMSDQIDGYSALKDFDSFKNFLTPYRKKLKNEKIHLILDTFDIKYRSFKLSRQSFDFEGNDKENFEKSVLFKSLQFLPKDSEVGTNYVASILTSYETTDLYYVTAAYINSEYLNNIKSAFQELNLGLIGISPIVFMIHNAINPQGDCLYLKENEYAEALFTQGIYVWNRTGSVMSAEDEDNFIKKEIQDTFNVAVDVLQELNTGNLDNYLKPNLLVDSDTNTKESYIAAAAFFDEKNQKTSEQSSEETDINTEDIDLENAEIKKGGLFKNVTDKLRQFLHFGGEEDI